MASRDRFLFLTLEDLNYDTSQSLQNVMNFLDINTGKVFDRELLEDAKACSKKGKPIYKRDPRYSMRKETKAQLEIFFSALNFLLSNALEQQLSW